MTKIICTCTHCNTSSTSTATTGSTNNKPTTVRAPKTWCVWYWVLRGLWTSFTGKLGQVVSESDFSG